VQSATSFLLGGGETGALIGGFDWASTSLGPISGWPQSLKTATALLVHSPVPIVMLWGEDGFMIYNDAYSVFAGGRHPHVLGKKVREAWPEVAEFNDHVMKVGLAGGTLAFRDQELTLYRNGAAEQVWMNLDYSPVIDESGSPAGVIAIVVETTERVLADRRIGAERDRLRRMFDQAPGFMALLDGPDHVITLTNRAYQELIGHRDVMGMPLRAALPEAVEQGFVDILDTCFSTGQPFVGTGTAFRVQRGSFMEEVLLDFVYQPIAGRDGRISGVFLQGQDVTARVRADIARRESEARFREVANAAPALIWVTDTGGSATWFNKPWLDFVGDSLESQLVRGWMRHMHPDDHVPFARMKARAYECRTPFRLDFRLRRADGQYRVFDDTGVPRFDAAGRFLGFIGSCLDVTEARAAVADLRRLTETLEARVQARTAELEAANRLLVAQIDERERVEATLRRMQRLEAVGQLTAGVAHDFNNLLTVVLGNISFLERALEAAPVEPRTRARLGYMKSAAERGATLTGQLLAFSRRQRLEAKPLNLNETVASMRDLLQSSMGGAVKLQTRLDPYLWTALVDATQIELVILNLAINARDAMQVGGLLTVATANASLGEPERPEDPPAGDYVAVAVEDTGSGMTPEVLSHAFEPFFTTKEVGRGSGLGLAQVFGFAKQSGGGVRIETALGRGTTVRVYLPRSIDLAGALPEAAPSQPASPLPGGQRRVLVVDDDSAVRHVTASMLGDLGCSVQEADSGEVALARLETQPPFDLVVLDFAMPDMNGAQLASAILSRRPEQSILFVTGYADQTALQAIGENRIVKKPFRSEDLAAKVRRMLA
jgi:PAS domain S-box-containing protein